MERNRDSKLIGKRLAACLDFAERRRTVDVRLPDAEVIEIGSIENHDSQSHCATPSIVASPSPARSSRRYKPLFSVNHSMRTQVRPQISAEKLPCLCDPIAD